MPKRKSKNSCKTEKRKKFKEELANEEDGETEDKKSSETHTSDQEEESQSIKTVETRSEEKLEKVSLYRIPISYFPQIILFFVFYFYTGCYFRPKMLYMMKQVQRKRRFRN